MADNTGSGTTVFGADGRPKTTTLSDGTVINWEVDLPKLAQAASVVASRSLSIRDLSRSLEAEMAAIESYWRAPSGDTFTSLKTAFTSVSRVLNDLLDDAVRRMKAAHANYVATETTNTQMLK